MSSSSDGDYCLLECLLYFIRPGHCGRFSGYHRVCCMPHYTKADFIRISFDGFGSCGRRVVCHLVSATIKMVGDIWKLNGYLSQLPSALSIRLSGFSLRTVGGLVFFFKIMSICTNRELIKFLASSWHGLGTMPSLCRLSSRRRVETFQIHGESGAKCQVEIQFFWDNNRGRSVRVVGSIDDGGIRAFVPLTQCSLISPPGSMMT